MSTIDYTQPVAITERVQRLTCRNPGAMTGPGTNTFIVGTHELAVIDPGPDDAEHLENLIEAVGDKLRWIVVTHTHPDHSPAAVKLAAATGAEVLGNKLNPNDGFQDEGFAPLRGFEDGEPLCGDGFTLRAVATPGHVDNHLCFLLEEEGVLFTGDHIMQGSTVVIIPPHGDMQAYIASLQKLLDLPLTALAPAHGEMINEPFAEVERLVAHRLEREAKVIAVMEQVKQGTLDELTPQVYDDVDTSLHAIARYSLWAHLIKLEKEGRITSEQQHYVWK